MKFPPDVVVSLREGRTLGNRQLFPEKSAKELLEQFRQSGSNQPFEEIVRRYAAMVFGVCLRVTGDKHDAEDAVQAVFLSLALQAKTDREIKYIGPWLQKVAHRLALDVKKSKTRRKRREEKLAEQTRHTHNGNGRHTNGGGAFGGGNGHVADPADAPGAEELKTIMMEELNQLPAKYRMPLVMHYFGGLSRDEMATELGCNPSTLGVRVHRGKAMLGTRLAKRGIAISAIAMTVVLEHVVRDAAFFPMISTAATTGNALAAGHGMSIALASAKAIGLVRTALRSAAYVKLKYAVAIMMVMSSAAYATGSEVVRQIRQHLPTLDLREWVRPLFRGVVPTLQADASDQDPLAPLNAPELAAVPDPQLSIDWDKLGLNSGAGDIEAGRNDRVVAGAVAVTRPPQAPPGAPPSPDFSFKPTAGPFNAVASSLLSPPVVSRPFDKSQAGKGATVGADGKSGKSDSSGAAEETKPVAVASASATFTLGAGGGGGSGKPQIYTLPANESLHVPAMVVGDSGFGVFRQLGGNTRVDGQLTVGRQKGAVGRVELSGGTLTAKTQVIGDLAPGSFIQTDGVNIAQDSLLIGKSNVGWYAQSGGSTKVISRPEGTFFDNFESDEGLQLGVEQTGDGRYDLSGGTLSADPQIVGNKGSGKIHQSGGKNATGQVFIAHAAGSTGQYVMDGGLLQLNTRPAGQPDPAIQVGGEGQGAFNLGNGANTGAIYEVGNRGGASIVVRGQANGSGILSGWGPVHLKGVLVNNGQVVADGVGVSRTLDMSSFSGVATSIDNPRWGGTNGWFARRKGLLKLPSVKVQPGTGTYTWGEDPEDLQIDLVNSVRFDIENAHYGGDVAIALLSPLRGDVPALPRGHKFIGVWSFDGSELGGFDAVDLQIRYDDAMAHELGINEEMLKVWAYDAGTARWQRLDSDPGFARNTLDKLIAARATGDFDFFAVSAPEPGSAVLVGVAAGLMTLRRRRRQAKLS